MYNIRIN